MKAKKRPWKTYLTYLLTSTISRKQLKADREYFQRHGCKVRSKKTPYGTDLLFSCPPKVMRRVRRDGGPPSIPA